MRPTGGFSPKGLSLAGLGLCGIVFFCGRGAAQDTPVPDSPLVPIPQYSTSNEPLRYSLKGAVVNAATGEVIRGARVELETAQDSGDASGSRSIALSDLHGQFEFAGLPAAPARVSANKPGFFSEPDAARVHPLQTFWVGPDAPPVVVKLVPEAVIAGRIVSEHDEPVEGMSVNLISETVEQGRRTWVYLAEKRTNEDGEFRFAELPAGTYFVEADPWWRNSLLVKEPHRRGLHHVFFPDAHDFHAATAITLNAGQKYRADLQLNREPFYKVSGVVSGQTGGDLELECLDAAGKSLSFPATVDGKTGKFEVQVPAGSWVIHVRDRGDPEPSGKVALKVAGDMKEVRLQLAPDLSAVLVVGRVESMHAGAQESPASGGDGNEVREATLPAQVMQAAAFVVGLAPQDPLPWSEHYSASTLNLQTGEVPAFLGLKPGRYRLFGVGNGGEVARSALGGLDNAGWYVKSVQSGGADLLRDGLTVAEEAAPQTIEVVLRDDGATLTGVVTAQGRPSPGAVLLVSENIALYNRVAIAGRDGRFVFKGLAPGDYSVLVLEDGETVPFAEPGVWPNYAQQVTPVKLEADQKMELQLERVSSGRQAPNVQ